MAIIPTLDYLADYYDLEPSLFRESDNLHKLFQSIFYVCHDQQIDLLWFAENILNIDAAEKSHLDFIGSLVGQPRFLSDFNTEPYFGYEGSYHSKPFSSVTNPDIGGFWNSRSYFNTATARQLNDGEYRRLIKARTIYNQSNCTANDLLEVINLLSNSKNNTVQLLQHGLIQISADDDTGILSYFVDRLYLEDNILPIAAGVRVGLEQSATDSSGGGILDTDWEVKKLYEGSTGSKVGIDAVRIKNNLEVESSIEVTPTIGQISDRIKSGEYGTEVNKAVLDIDPEATDWVLDPANNAVKYKEIGGADSVVYEFTFQDRKYRGASGICNAYFSQFTADGDVLTDKAITPADNGRVVTCSAARSYTCSSGTCDGRVSYQFYGTPVPEGEIEWYTLPIETVAAKVIENAEAGHAESKSLLISVVSVLASMKFYDPLF